MTDSCRRVWKNNGFDSLVVAFLFERYQQLTSLLPVAKPKRRRRATEGSR